MKKIIWFLTLILVSFFAMGMSGFGGTPEGSVPIPHKDFKAVITDVNDVKTECNFVSVSGNDFLKGTRGSASVTVPFENIVSLTITLVADEKDVDAVVKLKEGNDIELKLNGNANLTGKTDFGTVKIKVREIKSVTISAK